LLTSLTFASALSTPEADDFEGRLDLKDRSSNGERPDLKKAKTKKVRRAEIMDQVG
jgi:hypothetical protein